jgi:large subunit ribosomal protein L35
MPKQKTRKAVAKRFKLTASGKVKRASAGRGHLLSGKSRKRKRKLRSGALVSKGDMKRIVTQIAS